MDMSLLRKAKLDRTQFATTYVCIYKRRKCSRAAGGGRSSQQKSDARAEPFCPPNEGRVIIYFALASSISRNGLASAAVSSGRMSAGRVASGMSALM